MRNAQQPDMRPAVDDGQTVGRATEDTRAERRLLHEHTFDGASAEVDKALAGAAEQRITDMDRLEQAIAYAVSRFIQRTYPREPVGRSAVVMISPADGATVRVQVLDPNQRTSTDAGGLGWQKPAEVYTAAVTGRGPATS